jgi:5-methylcytosine-specific restriction endonuclease McrA
VTITAKYRAYLKSDEWKQLRAHLIARAHHLCERCHAHARILQLHHRHYRNIYHEQPEDIEVLCKKCHKIADAERKGMRKKRRRVRHRRVAK